MTATREEILAALDTEEAYQLSRWGPDAHKRTFDEWVMYISTYAQDAQQLTTHGDERGAKDTIRKIASMCFHFMMQNGVHRRVGILVMDNPEADEVQFFRAERRRPDGEIEIIEFEELREGDEFRILNPDRVTERFARATGDPFPCAPSGNVMIRAEYI